MEILDYQNLICEVSLELERVRDTLSIFWEASIENLPTYRDNGKCSAFPVSFLAEKLERNSVLLDSMFVRIRDMLAEIDALEQKENAASGADTPSAASQKLHDAIIPQSTDAVKEGFYV